MKNLKTALCVLFGAGLTVNSSIAAMSGAEAGGLALQGLGDDPSLRQLYSEGLVVPNQPLAMKDSERKAARDYVQQFIDMHKAAEGDFKRQERRVINALLFNYGLQLLDDGRVVILDVYMPVEKDANGNVVPSLMPGMPLDKNSTLTRANAAKLYEEAVKERQKYEQAMTKKAQQARQDARTKQEQANSISKQQDVSILDSLEREFN